MGKMIGIDLGGAYTRVMYAENETFFSVPLGSEDNSIPTALGYDRASGSIVTGEKAARLRLNDPANAVWNLPGLLFPDRGSLYIKALDRHSNLNISQDERGEVSLDLGGKRYSGTDLMKIFLTDLLDLIHASIGDTYDSAVITVPDSAGSLYRSALKEAAESAGFKVILLSSQTLAAVAGNFFEEQDKETNCCVIHLGYNRSFCQHIEVYEGVYENKGSLGETEGLWHADLELALKLREDLEREDRINIDIKGMGFIQLWAAAERLREQSSTLPTVSVDLGNLVQANGTLTEKTITMGSKVLGSFYTEQLKQLKEIGISTRDKLDYDSYIFSQETAIPAGVSRNEIDSLFSVTREAGIPPEEAAVQGAGVRSGTYRDQAWIDNLLLIDVFSRRIVMILGDQIIPFIEAGGNIPIKNKQVFSTSNDNQSAVELPLFEGIGDNPENYNSLGNHTFSGIPPAAKGVAQVEICIDLDPEGLLDVSARETTSDTNLIRE